MGIGANIKQRREYLGYNQNQLAQLCKITPAALCQIEGGIRKPQITTFAKIADALRCTMDELYYNETIIQVDMKIYKRAMKDLGDKLKNQIDEFQRGFYFD